MANLAVEVTGLTKSYGSLEAVKGIDLRIGEGEVFALLGPNGAGKTTTVEILEGYRGRDAGEVRVLGFDPARGERAFKERVGIVLQETGVEPFLKVEEVIELYRGYYPDPLAVNEIIEIVGLTDKRKSRVGKLSGGQQRRLDVAVGLAGNPSLFFLDEPTTGFDPSARRNAWKMIENLKQMGKTVLLTTHYMDEAQHLADRVAIIVAGRIVAEGAPGELIARERVGATIEFRLPQGAPSPPASLGTVPTQPGGPVRISADEPVKTLHSLTSWALENSVDLEGLTVSRPSLEDVYLDLTTRAERQELPA